MTMEYKIADRIMRDGHVFYITTVKKTVFHGRKVLSHGVLSHSLYSIPKDRAKHVRRLK